LAWIYAPTLGKVQGQGGGWREKSISGCGLARDNPPLTWARGAEGLYEEMMFH